MESLLNSVEKIKNKLTDKQYKKIMDELGKVHKLVQPTKKITIFYVKCTKDDDGDGDNYVEVEPEFVQFIQTVDDPSWDAHPKRDGFVTVPICHLSHILTKENFQTLLLLSKDCDDEFVRQNIYKLKIE